MENVYFHIYFISKAMYGTEFFRKKYATKFISIQMVTTIKLYVIAKMFAL